MTTSTAPCATLLCRNARRALRRVRDERGFLVIDAVIGMVFLLIVFGMVAVAIPNIFRFSRGAHMASDMTVIATGMNRYIKDNFGTLAGTGTVTAATLVAGQYVPPQMAGGTDPFSDSYVMQYRVVSGSEIDYGVGVATLPPTTNGLISFIAVTANGQTRNGDAAGVVGVNASLGQAGAWDTMVAGLPALISGAPVVVGSVGPNELVNDNLYRTQVPGHPETTQENSALDMTQHDIDNVQNLGVLGNASVTGLTSANGGLTVVGATNATGAVTVTGNSQFNGIVNVSGTLTGQGQIVAQSFDYTSDMRLKTNIRVLAGVEEKLMQLHGVEYDWRDGSGHDISVLAQEVQAVYPDMTFLDDKGILRVRTGNLVAPLLEETKDLVRENRMMRAQIEQLNERLNDMSDRLRRLDRGKFPEVSDAN